MSKAKSISKAWRHPKLGMIPSGWEVLRFADAFEFLPTNSFSRDQMTYKGSKDSVFNIHYGDIHATFTEQLLDFKKHLSQVPVLANNGISLDDDELLKDGDLIIADASEDYHGIGECIELAGIGNKKVIAGLHTLAAREKLGKISPGFRAYLLKHPRVFIELKKLATGSKVYGISKTNVANLEVIVPPSDENQKIARILSTWDKALEKTEQLIAQKQQLKKGLMQQLLTGKVRFKEFVESKEMKKTKLGLVPKDWEAKKLGEICSTFKSGNGITSANISPNGRYKVYGGNGLRGYTDSYTHDGDYFLIGRQGALCGNIVRISGRNYVSEHAIAVQTDKFNNNSFLAYQLEFMNLNRLSESSAQPGLSVEKLLKLNVRAPELKEQKIISQAIEAMEHRLILLVNKKQQLLTQKKGLIQKLLTGEVRVKV